MNIMTVKKHHVIKYPHMRQLRLAPKHALDDTSCFEVSPSSQKVRGAVWTVMDAVIHECVGGQVYIAIHERHHFHILYTVYVCLYM